jgi:hypothetical protein
LIDLEAGFTAKSKKEFTPSAPAEEVKTETSSVSSSTGSGEKDVSDFYDAGKVITYLIYIGPRSK